MKLLDYIKIHGRGDLAANIDTSPAYLSQLAHGYRRPSAELAITIERFTKGAVRCEDLRPDVDWSVLRGTPAAKATDAA